MQQIPLADRVENAVRSFRERTSRLKKETKLNEP